ncbi:unnamed protein product [Cylicocyclus nassatus]|uniref:Peptidase C1A papain C-terminal domain-containing protein n=1 Tax=Cylicocyclus nassatus TaxID=53992 RepID=A0AA36LYX5_CYLNA|nr:unnamed protein product [Cylicocyclus nassatus]
MGITLVLLAALCTTAYSITVEEFKALPIPESASNLEGQAFVDFINENQPFYKAEIPKMSFEQFQSRLMNFKYLKKPVHAKTADELVLNEPIPERFDAREKWPYCDSMKQIRDQANCGSCWAVSAASTMSDRLCAHSQGEKKTIISDTDILACCGSLCGEGCEGGVLLEAWEFVMKEGACSGGPYLAKDCCKYYPFHPCGKHAGQPYYGECSGTRKTPACRKTCAFGYKPKYDKDKNYASSAYCVNATEEAIQKEIMINGPVQTGYEVYSDFYFYKRGVYVHKTGKQYGAHAVKIIGWGVENGVKYWLVANSWNYDWGEDGFFKILRGTNECNIESWVVAGAMKV